MGKTSACRIRSDYTVGMPLDKSLPLGLSCCLTSMAVCSDICHSQLRPELRSPRSHSPSLISYLSPPSSASGVQKSFGSKITHLQGRKKKKTKTKTKTPTNQINKKQTKQVQGKVLEASAHTCIYLVLGVLPQDSKAIQVLVSVAYDRRHDLHGDVSQICTCFHQHMHSVTTRLQTPCFFDRDSQACRSRGASGSEEVLAEPAACLLEYRSLAEQWSS